MPRITQEDADHSLEDLEVREVSVVDRPANKRRFLVVKNDTEENMPNQVTTVDLSAEADNSAAELLGILGNEDETPQIREFASLEGLEVVFKATTVDGALKALTPVLQKLMDTVSEMKKVEAPTDAMIKMIKAVRRAIDLVAGGKGEETEETKKADGGIKGAALALQALTSLVKKLKDKKDKDKEIEEGDAKEMQKISLLLSKVAPTEKKAPEKTDEEKEKEKEEAKKAEEKDGQMIVLKAGAKMRKARLRKLKKAVEILSAVLKELEDGPPKDEDDKDKKKDKDKKRVGKSDDTDELIASLQKQVADLTTKVEKADGDDDKTDLSDVMSELKTITKRLDGLENARPAGEGDDDPPPPEPVKKSLWGNVIRQ